MTQPRAGSRPFVCFSFLVCAPEVVLVFDSLVGHSHPEDLTTNLYRIHDWRLEITDGQPISKNLGFSWHPGLYTLIVNDPAIVRHILKDEFNKYTKPNLTLDPFFYYLKDSFVTSV